MISTAWRRSGAAALLAVLAACGGPEPPPVPRPSGTLDRCPPPLTFGADEVRPIRVRFDNPTPDTLTVFIDRCRHHTRLADVAPGRWVQVPLPDRLVAFPEGLRFHVFHLGEHRRVGTFTAEVRSEPILMVRLGEEGVVPDADLVPVGREDGEAGVGDFAVSNEFGGYAAVWARGSAAILTWSCGEDGRRHLTVSTGDKLPGGHVDVRMATDGSRSEPVGRWQVQEGITDAVRVPEASVESITRTALESREISFVLIDADNRGTAHAFGIDDLRDALSGLACFGPLLLESPPPGVAGSPHFSVGGD